jgi:hypothetical protein
MYVGVVSRGIKPAAFYRPRLRRRKILKTRAILLNPVGVGILSYGFFRKTFEMLDASTQHVDKDTGERRMKPVLAVDKVLIVFACTLLSCFLWPVYVYNDLRRIEYLLDPELDSTMYEKKSKSHVIEFIFS